MENEVKEVSTPKAAPKKKAPTTRRRPSFNKKNTNKPVVYRLVNGGSADRKGGTKYPLVSIMPATDVIYDPETNTNREIRYIAGEASIFTDEQRENARVGGPITFHRGHKIVQHTEPTLLKFLDMMNANSDNPNRMTQSPPRFSKVNNENNAKESIDKSMLELDAISAALKMPIDKLVGYARVLGLNVDKSTDEIRYDMKVLAQKDPQAFMAGVDDPRTEVQQTILDAVDYNVISFSEGANKVCWVRGAQRPTITNVPVGITHLEKLTDFVMSDEGYDVYKEIEKQLSRFAE